MFPVTKGRLGLYFMQEKLLTFSLHMQKLIKQYATIMLQRVACLYINQHSACLSVCRCCSPLPADQPWQVR